MNNLCIFAPIMLQIVFKDQELADLFEGKKVKLFQSNPQLVRQFVKVINKLKSAPKIEILYQINSLNYEALSGDKKGYSSVRINDQYRLIFEEIREEKEPFNVKVIAIEKISNHYS